jgi:2-dehydro-3-deoxyphosphogluconate aldolase / (4S)-4-hydroxy-2-oxoglutarate aldolase
MTTLSQLQQHKIIAIIRGAAPKAVLPIVQALHEGGVSAVEVTLNSANALQVIKELSGVLKDKMLVGAGTVLDAASAADAIEAGAQFIIAPSVDVETIKFTKEKGIVSIPGAFTATEIVTAYKAGADMIKVFPATSPQYIKELKGPLNHIPLMPTGGINLLNIKDFQKAGAVAFGIGSALVDVKQELTKEYLKQLTEKARLFVQAINQH